MKYIGHHKVRETKLYWMNSTNGIINQTKLLSKLIRSGKEQAKGSLSLDSYSEHTCDSDNFAYSICIRTDFCKFAVDKSCFYFVFSMKVNNLVYKIIFHFSV